MGRIDVHAHLLPGVDDGSRSIDESLAIARRMVGAGYSHLVCTPHVWRDLDNTTMTVALRVAELQGHLDSAGVPLTLVPGGEMSLDQITRVDPGDAVTYAGAGKYVLFDFWNPDVPDWFDWAVGRLIDAGLKPILAHPERIEAVQKRPDLVRHAAERGLLLQGNLECVGEGESTLRGRLATRWLREDRYFLLGTDLHRLETLGKRLLGLDRAADLIGPDGLDRLTIENPRQLLGKAA